MSDVLSSIVYGVEKIVDPIVDGVVAFQGSIYHPRIIIPGSVEHNPVEYWVPLSKGSGSSLHIKYSGDPQGLIGVIRVTSYGETREPFNMVEHLNKVEKLVDGVWKEI